uniref:cytochrome c oxidase subunit III n=1 Tax=Ixodes ornithorhynchi TaxID=85878 RepID=UPI00286AD054|nr:cytochrome c oxidase subunit III [Ixodes ornithorhynchi]WKW95243.1 cytochrome c oxidase subunit 3 [Ixodes ornithorhynchi]WKW95256.1 cytochrome c oxidase subunit 3 [Ixodes ornithorhynchi]
MMYHPFHMVEKSPWPLTSGISALTLMMSMIYYLHYNFSKIAFLATIIMLITMFQWWRDISREASFQGNHTLIVIWGLKLGMILFIISEVFFFLSFFWTFFYSSLSPNIEIGSMWPPHNIIPFNPFEIPLLNTTILISSGISISWSHHSLINKNYYETYKALMITIILGLIFTALQSFEYFQAQFSISDSVYGATFFLTTGFHGIHVIIGTSFLLITLIRINKNHLSSSHHFGFEAAAWYWHFVDVVWLFLFTFMYWWVY